MKKFIASLTALLIPSAALALTGIQRANQEAIKFGDTAGFNPVLETGLPDRIGRYIGAFLGLLGSVFVILMIYGGYLYMTAQGNEDQVTKGKDVIKNAIIGIAIVFLAYAITTAVIRAMV